MLTVVTGPPCSGKSTYVRTHRQPGDLVIDFDDLARSLGSPDPHDHAAPVRFVARAARAAAIPAAIGCHHRGARVWIVDCNPPRSRRQQYHIAGAHIVTLTADPADLHRRADAERPALWHQLIDDWLTEHAPPPTATAHSAAPATAGGGTPPAW